MVVAQAAGIGCIAGTRFPHIDIQDVQRAHYKHDEGDAAVSIAAITFASPFAFCSPVRRPPRQRALPPGLPDLLVDELDDLLDRPRGG